MYLSVIVPTHNRGAILKKCIDSLLNQSLSQDKYEIVIVDDGSDDGTARLVKDNLLNRGNLKYFYQNNKGPAAARNLGIKNAEGEIILFTGDDIIADRELLNIHFQEYLNSDEKTSILGFITWHPELKITKFMRYLEQGTQFNYQNLKDQDYVAYGYFVTSNVSLKKELLLKAGLFDEDFLYPCFEDVELALRLDSQGMKVKYVNSAKAYHYHETNLKAYSKRQYLAGKSIALFCRKHPEQMNILFADYSVKNLFFSIFKNILAKILIKPVELLGSDKALYKCYGAVLNYYKLLGFYRGRSR